ncbi:MAG: phosphoglycerate dehydrogenase [Anaerolineae bacterium]|nr:phosphoglycerate dehydrogenase [Anaerolineae bacterium]
MVRAAALQAADRQGSIVEGKILVTARSFRKLDGPHKQMLIDAGLELVNSPHNQPLDAAGMAALVPGVAGVILGLDEVNAAVLARADALRVIARFGVGVDNVDLAAATARGVVVTNTPGANSVAVAELTIALMLALARHVPQHNMVVKGGGWSRITGYELSGLTLGLIGMGRIGQEVARRAAAFEMRLLYHDPVPPPAALAQSLGLSACPLDELLAESDIISLHLPLTDETRNLIDRSALQRVKPSAFLVNTSRGGWWTRWRCTKHSRAARWPARLSMRSRTSRPPAARS